MSTTSTPIRFVAFVILLLVGLAAAMFHEYRVASVLQGDYDSTATCDGNWWTAKATARATAWSYLTVVNATTSERRGVSIPAFRLAACAQAASEVQLAQAAEAFETSLQQGRSEALASFERQLPRYLDERYSAANAITDSARDLARAGGACWDALFTTGLRGCFNRGWNELGKAPQEAEQERLNALYGPAREAFLNAAETHLADTGPYGRLRAQYANALVERAMGSTVQSVAAYDPLVASRVVIADSGPADDTTVKDGTYYASLLGTWAAGTATQAAADRVVGRAATRAGALMNTLAVEFIVVPIVIVKIDELLNREMVEKERRTNLAKWLETRTNEMASAYADAVGEFARAVRTRLLETAATGHLIVVMSN